MRAASIRCAAGVIALTLFSCGLLFEIPDISGIIYYPDRENQVLEKQSQPFVRFDFDADHSSVEKILAVSDAAGSVPGSFHWDRRTVRFLAEPELVPGRRYLFSFSGTFEDSQGLSYSVNYYMPFYYENREEPAPYIVDFWPLEGQTIAREAELKIYFSKDIDPLSLQPGFSLTPDTKWIASWTEGTKQLSIRPESRWENHSIYTMRFGGDIRDQQGVPLAQIREIVFLVQEDLSPPQVNTIVPVFNRPEALFPETGEDLESDIGVLDALKVTFSEEMDQASTEDSLSLQPFVSAVLVWIGRSTLVFSPESRFAAGTEYCLDFGVGAEDLAGNPLTAWTAVRFATEHLAIEVSTELLHEGIVIEPGDYTTAAAREIEPYSITSENDYTFSFSFSGATFDTNNEKAGVQEAIRLECILPLEGAADPSAIGYSWTGDQRLSVTYTEVEPSTSDQRIYYLLTIRGGSGGVASEEGSMLPYDLEQLLVTIVK